MCNSTNPGNVTEQMKNTTYTLVFGSVMTLGLPLNAVSLWIFVRRHSLKSPNAVYMVNLVISDLLLIFSLPLRVFFYATGKWPLGDMVCIWITMLFHNNIRSSSIFITFICVDRVLAVVYPLRTRYLRTLSKAWKAALFVWLCVLLLNIPESVLFSQFLKDLKGQTCFEFPRNPEQGILKYLQPVLVLTLLAVNVVSTVLVSLALHKFLSDSAKVNNKVNVMLIFIINLIMFTVFFLPVSLAVFFQDRALYNNLLCLASVNCCLDPLLYYFSFDGFWKKKEDVDTDFQRE